MVPHVQALHLPICQLLLPKRPGAHKLHQAIGKFYVKKTECRKNDFFHILKIRVEIIEEKFGNLNIHEPEKNV